MSVSVICSVLVVVGGKIQLLLASNKYLHDFSKKRHQSMDRKCGE